MKLLQHSRYITTLRCASLLEQQQLAPGDDEIVVRNYAALVNLGTELALFMGTPVGLPNPEVPFSKYPFPLGNGALDEMIACGAHAGTPVIPHS